MLVGFPLYYRAYKKIFLVIIKNHSLKRYLYWWKIKWLGSDLHSVWQIISIRNMKDLKSWSTVSESSWHPYHGCFFKAVIRKRNIKFLHLNQSQVYIRHWCRISVLSISWCLKFWIYGIIITPLIITTYLLEL